MQQLTGTITVVSPPDYTDQHGNQYQNVTITATNGTSVGGRIASKRGYSGGEAIIVEVTREKREDGSQWTRFKRVNPQQGQQGVSGGSGEQKSDDNAPGKVRHGLVCSAIESRQIEIRENQRIEDLLYWQEFIITGKAPLPSGQSPEGLDYGSNQPVSQGDDIPF